MATDEASNDRGSAALSESDAINMIVHPETVPTARMLLALAYYANGGAGTTVAEAAILGREPYPKP